MTNCKKLLFMKWFVYSLLFLFLCLLYTNSYAENIAFIVSRKDTQVKEIYQSFEKQITSLNIKHSLKVFVLADYKTEEGFLNDYQEFLPLVSVVVGDASLSLCKPVFLYAMVHLMVSDLDRFNLVDKKGANTGAWTGISKHVKTSMQLEALKKEIPSIKKVGMIYRKKDEKFVRDLKKAIGKYKIKLQAVQLAETDIFYKQFRAISKKIDTFWILKDHQIYDANTIDFLANVCKIKGINVVSHNVDHLKQGVSFALAIDYNKLGGQLSEIVAKILDGEKAQDIPLAYPNYFYIHKNEDNI